MVTNTEKINLSDLGYDTFFESKRQSLGLTGYAVGRVVAEYKESYRVRVENGEYLSKISGKQIFTASRRADYPAVGDWVSITELDHARAIIHHVLPRKTILRRKYNGSREAQLIAANLDVAFIIASMDRDFNLNRLERYLVLANDGKIKPAIILNKIDLILRAELDLRIEQIKNRFDHLDVIPTSTVTETGLEELMSHMIIGKTYCFLGSSGVGKSTLINRLLGRNAIKIKEISTATGKGRHTTSGRQMYFLKNGAIVIDNPGMREVGMADAKTGMDDVFREITDLSKKCKYANCTHTHEPGCAVREAIQAKKLDENKYLNYAKLKKETEYYEMNEVERKRKDRAFGRYVKKALDQKKEYES